MSNIKKIRQEIERRIENYWSDGDVDSVVVSGELEELIDFIDSLPEESENHGCGVEFPHFGANYPDAKCIDGYLWDMDSYEDGVYTIGGDDPCPICNTEEWLKDVLNDEIFETRDEALEYVKMLKSKYKNKDSLQEEKPSEDLEEAAEELFETMEIQEHENIFEDTFKKIFIAGAEWQAKQLLKGSPLPEDTVLFQKGVNEGRRLEKDDLALTWEDMAKIDAIILDVNNEFAVDYSKEIDRQKFYEEVLKRFKDAKE